jgi:hypothetical protein
MFFIEFVGTVSPVQVTFSFCYFLLKVYAIFICFYVLKLFFKNNFFKKINTVSVFSNYFDVLISKIIFKNKKIYYFNIFSNILKNNNNYPPKHSHNPT